MSKQLYAFSISPGDAEHLAGDYFANGVVEAEPDEIEAIVKQIDAKHYGLLDITPIDAAKVDIAEFRKEVGRGLRTYHGEEVMFDVPCVEDAPYIEESVRVDFLPNDFEDVMRGIQEPGFRFR